MEEETLKVLQNIEKLLKAAMANAGNKLPNSSIRNEQARKGRVEKEMQKTFSAIVKSSKETNDALLGLNKNLVDLDAQVGRTTTGFSSLNSQITRFSNSLSTATQTTNTAPSQTGTGSNLINSVLTQLRSQIASILPGMQSPQAIAAQSALTAALNAQTTQATQATAQSITAQSALTTALNALNLQVASAASIGPIPATNTTTQQAANILSNASSASSINQNIAPIITSLQNATTPFGQTLGTMLNAFASTATVTGGLGLAFNKLIDVAVQLSSDFLKLARMGLGSTSNLATLSINALKAGMSVEEYTKMLTANISVASRQGSLDQFDKLISAADGQLAAMGIFGSEARVLQANLAQASTLMGISQTDLAKTNGSLISTFADLQKSVNMTADEFSTMVMSLSKNEQIQRELVGLAPGQRAIRQAELVQIASTGKRLGLTAEASENLAKALIEQRKATVVERLDSRAALMQAAAFIGRGDIGARAGELALKKVKTGAETEEFRNLVGQIDAGLQGIQNNGNLSAQNVADNLSAQFGKGGIQGIIDANRDALLSTQSGPAAANKDFGQAVGVFWQAVGNFTALLTGFKTSVVAPLVAGLSGALLVLFRGPITALLGSVASSLGAGVGAGAAGAGALSGLGASISSALGLGAAGSAISGIVSTLASPLTALSTLFGSITAGVSGYLTSIRIAFTTFSAAVGGGVLGTTVGTLGALQQGVIGFANGIINGGRALINGVWGITRAFGPIAMVFSGIMEAFTGEVSNVLNPSGGFFNRIGGIATAFFSAIPNFIFDALEFVFGNAEIFGISASRVRNSFELIVSFMNMAIKDFLSTIVGDIGALLKIILPEDSGLVKLLESTAKRLQDSAVESDAVIAKLANDEKASFKTIAKEKQDANAKTTKATVDATKQQVSAQEKFNNVAYGPMSIDAIKADARSIIGQPQVQVPQSVAPAPVNTPATPAVNNVTSESATTNISNTEIMGILNSILQVMKENLAAEAKQAVNSDTLLKVLRPNIPFADPEQTTKRILQQGYQ